uniref:Uncharacterized protein n=1 Tax=Meloidogyne javanica TaxID=6303 RepID=A0A915M318_MELJA
MLKAPLLTLEFILLLICVNLTWSDHVLDKLDESTEKKVKKLLNKVEVKSSDLKLKFGQLDFQTTPIYEVNKKQNINMVQYNSENNRNKRSSSNSNGKLIRDILKAIFGEEAVKNQSTSSNLQQLRSFNRQLSVNYPPYPQQDSDDEGSDIGHEHSQSTYYSYRDRKRRSVNLMSQNDKEKVENGGIQENNSDKNSTINSDNNADANQNDSKSGDIYIKNCAEKIIEDNTEQQKLDKKFKDDKGSCSSTLEGNILTFGEDTKNKNSSFPRIFPINFEMKTRKKRDIFDDLRQAWINCGRWLGDIFLLINLIAYFGIFVYLCYIL